MLKKTVNLVALMMLVSTNVLSPFSYAGEIGAVSEETIDANFQTENFYETQSGNTQDSSVKSQNDEKDSQNDGIVVPLGERGYGEAEGIYSGEEEKILSPSDLPSSDGVEGIPLDVQDDEGEIENNEQKDSDLEDMPKILADEISPIDMLTLELEKSEQPQVQDVSTVIDYYPDSNVRYTLNGNENFTAGTITITDGTDTITILDRNLGATAAGTGCHYKTNGKTYCSYDDTYGYHFQWGNNHGFKPGCDLSGSIKSCSDSTTLNAVSGQVDATTISYNPANQEYYNSGVFYKGSGDWLNDSNKVNLWGGSTGDSTTFVELTEEQAKLRQGPCPKGFHVPSVGELVKLSSMMTGSSDSEKDVQLHNLLYIPYAGFRDLVDAYVYDMGYYTFMWSSSPQPSHDGISYYLTLLDGINYYISRGSRADAYSIRCFYDKYETYEVPEVDTTPPAKPEIGCPNNDEIRECVANEEFCPQYDFNKDGIINQSDALLISRGVCTTDNSFINENNDITNSKNPRFIRSTPGGAEGVEEIGGYEMQICSDSGCNNVIHSGSYEEVVGHTDLDDGKYYWRVKTIDKAGNEGERSDILSFTVDTIAPVKPEIGCPDAEEVLRSINMRIYCPQYDFDLNGRLNANDATLLMKLICTSGDSDTFIKADGAVTSNKTPRFVRSTPGGTGGAKEIGGYEIQICSDSSCNNVAYSGSYEEIVQNELSAGKYYWRVKAIDNAGNEGEWSDILSFTVTGDEEKKSGGSSGGGGRSSKTSDIHPISSQNDNSVSSGAIAKDLRGDIQDSSNKSLEGQEILSSSDSHNSAGQVSFTNDQKEAYEFARSNGITTTSSIEKAKMNTTLTRIQMAKMLSNFAINVMKQEPDVSKGIIKFNDVTNKMNKQYDYAVTKAYQLGIMGQNMKDNNFRPDDEVSRAEFATALSRLLYSTSDGEYKNTSKYYIHHMEKLKKEGIITKDDPKMKEKRGYVMIMLMRSVK